jgi:hypothetical protein
MTLRFLNHRTGHYGGLSLSQRELILQLIKHISKNHFRVIRYFGFWQAGKDDVPAGYSWAAEYRHAEVHSIQQHGAWA